ncbi:Nitrate reductase-like protein narX [Listeria grayi]|uniref:Nitrate reductase gamma subunit n=1 Tax=Listeria grayi FSL F6-1183 TaxID=1265827 RepID=A0A829R7J6_LISGR|nr:respiratory nitrate reductase subunit gamma [Listeria grayi]EUJ27983.1 nitrate reductase gamma subunit [Listeria grayi FSL F6-1183]MBC1922134.1 respiratory nitrate reductase subunit gamma [Listeria grayi]VEI30754.1 Nitrate reductase-like protein narX [Listeria grayi]
MTNVLSILLWVVFPYLMLASFFFGSIIRIVWFSANITAKSSEIMERRQLIIGSILFHVGILGVIGGHVIGLVIPMSWTEAIGISNETYHIFALVMGGIFGFMAFIGMLILSYRRFTNLRVFITSSFSDLVVNIALLITMIMGLTSSLVSGPLNPAFNYRAELAVWFRQLFYFHPDFHLMAQVPLLFKIHVVCGFLILGFFPLTRLVHALAIPLQYTFRRFIVYRRQ